MTNSLNSEKKETKKGEINLKIKRTQNQDKEETTEGCIGSRQIPNRRDEIIKMKTKTKR